MNEQANQAEPEQAEPQQPEPRLTEYQFWIMFRQAFLMLVAAIEQRKLPEIYPTADLRKEYKNSR